MEPSVEAFFNETEEPRSVLNAREKIKNFIEYQATNNQKTVFVTSGGTSVPLEKNTVRYIDNFSEGRRGACSSEEFLKAGYAVIFLYRKHSFRPFLRKFDDENVLSLFSVSEEGEVTISSDNARDDLKMLTSVKKKNLLLEVPFISVVDYLFLLREISSQLNTLQRNALVYLAAAVSDFYIPTKYLSEHKIQSSDNPDGLSIKLYPVPKMVGPLVTDWCPNAFVVTFKLETNVDILDYKSENSLLRNKHQLVIGNLLQNYKDRVIFYQKGGNKELVERSREEIEAQEPIEKKIVPRLVNLHRV